jgi:hypothetical protein
MEFHWWRRLFHEPQKRGNQASRQPTRWEYRPRLEPLEARDAPAMLTSFLATGAGPGGGRR